MPHSFDGETVIITGAGKGIGRATAKFLSERGAKVVAIARTDSDLASLAAETGCRTIKADLLDPKVARATMQEAGIADHLVNCAGTNVLESTLDFTEEGYETVLGINLKAALICAQEFARARIAAGGGGAIVNVTSLAGHRGFANHLCYAASKAGLEGATRVLAKELGPHGIRVNAVAPGITLTELAAAAWSDPEKSGPMMARTPIGRFAEVEDVASMIAMLLSADSAMVTGAVLPVEGGFMSV
ncbi:SDR family oxidoreductase [Jiella avicenniae]|uniref:SDR family oxidoreductase n=1 Tax=Jiella avicenniae TaxID=2907202 RepID=A0A9X1P6A4_9HYPH|nr:SDR family oxidoreductase [Jiella avicenniae]MCE7030554.1 SDR family oxidoreductase [Jiella avicenniae]